MALKLNTIKGESSSKVSRRRGRGNGSNRGNYSGRGIKGQKARSGVSGLKLLGLKSLVSQTPKKRGFRSPNPDNQEISLKDLNNFQEGDKITPEKLEESGLIKTSKKPIKILKVGKLQVKKLSIKGVKLSAGASEEIQKNQGKIE